MMAGLFDYEDPAAVGRMMFAASLLNAGGPSKMPISTGQAIAQGLLARQQGASEAAQNARRNDLITAQSMLARAHAAHYMNPQTQQSQRFRTVGNMIWDEVEQKFIQPPQLPQAEKPENRPEFLKLLDAAYPDQNDPKRRELLADFVRKQTQFPPQLPSYQPITLGGSTPSAPPVVAGFDTRRGTITPPVGTAPLKADAAATAATAGDNAGVLRAAVLKAQTLLPIATGSGAGAIRDKVTDFFGIETDPAKAATDLETVAAQLIRFAPRFKGQDSNRDVQIYNQAVGAIGDRTKPASYRMQALATAQMLINKYSRQQQIGETDTLNVSSLRQEAEYAIANGADPAGVATRFKQLTGEDL
jgi:hypothetical protein